MSSSHWHELDYFAMLLKGESQACSALEYMVDDLHQCKELTVHSFLGHAGSEDFIWSLVKFLGRSDPRVAGNAAYIIGTIAESAAGRRRVISLTESRHVEKERILPDLVALLSSTDDESVMNAAGTIGTLAESEEGRDWLLQESCTQTMVEQVTSLLTNENALTASNAALVLARLTISERGCELLLDNQCNKLILSQLIGSLGTDEAGRGMNAAFAIGRLCDISKGRAMLLSLPAAKKMLTHLGNMLCSDDSGSSKNACFAISCLAASAEGHDKLLENSMCDRVMIALAQLLPSADLETGWFAAMTLRTFSSRPKGCIKLRELSKVVPALQEVIVSGKHNEDMIKEVEETLAILRLLDKPSPPVVTVLGPRGIQVCWSTVSTKSGLSVSYKLVDDESYKCLYSGTALEVTLSELSPCDTLVLRLRACVFGDDSPYSEAVTVTTDEDVPHEPSNLRLLARTATILKIGWEPPLNTCGVIKSYHIYLDGTHVDHTSELISIIPGLKEQTTYNIEVCAATSKGKGPKSGVDCVTADLGDHCPSKPSLSIMGRSEINVTWNPPQVPLGRITRYDVSSNGKVFYSGTDLHCTARHLHPNTEYTFVVTVITNEGPLESKPAKKRTAKDEYDCQRMPLYVPPIKKDEAKNDLDSASQLSYKKRKKKITISRTNSRDRLGSSTKLRNAGKRSSLSNTMNADKPDSAGSSSAPSTESPAIQESQSQSVITQSSSSDSASTSSQSANTRMRTGSLSSSKVFNNTRNAARAKSFSGSSTKPLNIPRDSFYPNRCDEFVIKESSSNNKTILAAFLTNQTPVYNSSHQLSRTHRASVPGAAEPERLARTSTCLNMVNIEPALPTNLQQRSSTFVGTKRQSNHQIKYQYTNVAHGNGTTCTMDVPINRLPLTNQALPHTQGKYNSTGSLPTHRITQFGVNGNTFS